MYLRICVSVTAKDSMINTFCQDEQSVITGGQHLLFEEDIVEEKGITRGFHHFLANT